MRLAVIPARGGSKRIPRKNIKLFHGLPILAWSIRAALKSNCFDLVIVSTDDNEIAEVARQHGASVPFVRPAELADDHTGTIPVIAHAIRWHEEQGQHVTFACCIYATAPFVRPEDLRVGINALETTGADFALSVTSYAFPIQRAVRITPQQRLEMFQPDHFDSRSQDLEEAWHDAGQFYWGRADAWLKSKPLFGAGSIPIVIPRHRVQDIDTPDDWTRAEWMYRALSASDEYQGG